MYSVHNAQQFGSGHHLEGSTQHTTGEILKALNTHTNMLVENHPHFCKAKSDTR